MENVLLFLAVLVLVKAVWTISLWPGKWSGLIFGGICVCFIASVHTSVLEWGKTTVDSWISDYDSLTGLSVWVMLDLLLTAILCRAVMQCCFGISAGRGPKWKLYIPPFLLFPALVYLHICLFYWLPGTDFQGGTACYALVVWIIVSGGARGIKKIFPDTSLRLELTGILSLLLFLVTVGCTVFHPSVPVPQIGQTTDWRQMFEVAGILLGLPVIGLVCRQTGYFCKRKFNL